MAVHASVTKTASNLARTAYRRPEVQHELLAEHALAWMNHEHRAPALLCFGRPGYALHRILASSDIGLITTAPSIRVKLARDHARFGRLSSISCAALSPDTRKAKNGEWSALYLLITCSKDLAEPLAKGWRVSGPSPERVESQSVLLKPLLYVDSCWSGLFDY